MVMLTDPKDIMIELFGVSFQFAGYSVKRALSSRFAKHLNGGLTPEDEELKLLCNHPIIRTAELSAGDRIDSKIEVPANAESRDGDTALRAVIGVELDGVPLNEDLSLDLSAYVVPKGSRLRVVGAATTVHYPNYAHKPRQRSKTGLLVEYEYQDTGRVVTFGSVAAFRAFSKAENRFQDLFLAALEYLRAPPVDALDDIEGCNWHSSN